MPITTEHIKAAAINVGVAATLMTVGGVVGNAIARIHTPLPAMTATAAMASAGAWFVAVKTEEAEIERSENEGIE